MQKRRREDARHQVLNIARAILLERIRQATPEEEFLALVEKVAERALDPHTAAEELAAAVVESRAG
jgi:putative protein kinase ArgK-like GTPase of G3E family